MKTTLLFHSVESVVTDDMASTTDGNAVCMPPFHTDVRGIKSSTQLRLPQGLAFVPPRKHGSLDPEQLPTEKQRPENLKTFVSGIHGQILRDSDPDKRLLYKSHKLLPVSRTCTSRSLCVCSLVFSYVFIFCTFSQDNTCFIY